MKHRALFYLSVAVAALACVALPQAGIAQATTQPDSSKDFQSYSHCSLCHNNLKTAKGEDASIGVEWSASIMANSARDPYWQGSVRREALDHPESSAAIQTECASCHMPLQSLQDKEQKQETEVFARLPLRIDRADDASAADGVSCAVCHQIQPTGLGTPATFSGNLPVAAPGTSPRPVFGPFPADSDSVNSLHVMSTGYTPMQANHIREAAMCGTCHTLYTKTRGPGGNQIGQLPEQMPYLEWLHSDYRDKQTCQQCHMPAVAEPVAVSSVLGTPREGVHHHTFVGANFFMEDMLDTHRDELAVMAPSADMASATGRINSFLQSQSARVTLGPAQLAGGKLSFPVRVENLTGHKLPTAYPSRRAWLHVVVSAADGHIVFESGKLNSDGSIAGNSNDSDPSRYSPHFTHITRADQVEIYEPILGDGQGHVTTGLLTATQYLKDNRILPTGFDKTTASSDIAVRGEASGDPEFTAGSSTTHYDISIKDPAVPLHIAAELVYQPIGFRWAHNLASYQAAEPQRFVHYYEQAAAHSAAVLAHAETSVSPGP